MGIELKEILIDSLQSFGKHSGRTYEGERLRLLMCSIEENGLFNPIIVQPVDRDKYEIISGHNRVKAMKELGRSTILAKIEDDLTEDKALEIFYESNFNQQSFSDWNYAQRIEAVQYCEKKIREYSQQGKRTDLEKDKKGTGGIETSVQSRQKLKENSKQATTRDKMARGLGISTATLSKYRRIIKLPDELLDSVVRLLDEKKITFEMAYIIADLRELEIKRLIDYSNEFSDKKIDLGKLKELPRKNNQFAPKSEERVKQVFIAEDNNSNSVKGKRR